MFSKEYLRECFFISGGDLIWKERPASHFSSQSSAKTWNSKFAGKKAGTQCGRKGKEYMRVTLDSVRTHAHKISFCLSRGRWPRKIIDHIDGNTKNNNPSNIRESSHSLNARNSEIFSTNTSGIGGVCWVSDRQRWMAYITNNGKQKRLGNFSHIFEAAAARISEINRMNYSPRHGRKTGGMNTNGNG